MKGATAYEYEWFGLHVRFLRPKFWFWPRYRRVAKSWQFPRFISISKVGV